MLSVSEEERRASDTVLFSSENNDIANQSVDTSFFTSEKNCMTNQLASLARRDDFYLDAFWLVNLGMYIIAVVGVLEREHLSSLSVKNFVRNKPNAKGVHHSRKHQPTGKDLL